MDLKTFTVTAEDCRKIVERFPSDDEEVVFVKIANVRSTGDPESIPYSHYFSGRIRDKFGINVVVSMSYKQVSFTFDHDYNFNSLLVIILELSQIISLYISTATSRNINILLSSSNARNQTWNPVLMLFGRSPKISPAAVKMQVNASASKILASSKLIRKFNRLS